MWLCGSRTRSPDYPEFGLFTFLFCREWQRNVPRFITIALLNLGYVYTNTVSNRHGYILSKPYPKVYGFQAFTRKRFVRLFGCYVVAATCFVTRDLETIIP